jgi:hypothetical protein
MYVELEETMKTKMISTFLAAALVAGAALAEQAGDGPGSSMLAAMPGAGLSLAWLERTPMHSGAFVGGAPVASTDTFRLAANA